MKMCEFIAIYGGFVHALCQTVNTSVFFFVLALQNAVNTSVFGCGMQ